MSSDTRLWKIESNLKSLDSDMKKLSTELGLLIKTLVKNRTLTKEQAQEIRQVSSWPI